VLATVSRLILDKKVEIETMVERGTPPGEGSEHVKITAQEEYGLRCLLRLARAAEGAVDHPRDRRRGEPVAGYVGKLLGVLRQAGVIESVRGRAGGYHLARPAEQIRLGGVLLVLASLCSTIPATARSTPARRRTAPASTTRPAPAGLWQTLEQWMRHVLTR